MYKEDVPTIDNLSYFPATNEIKLFKLLHVQKWYSYVDICLFCSMDNFM